MKGFLLTPRDHDLFVELYDLLFLDMDYLQEVIYLNDGKQISKPAIYRRTALLEANGFIKSFRLPIIDKANPAGRSKKVFVLDSKGVEEVRELIGESRWDPRWTDRTPLHIYHTLELASIKAAFATNENPYGEIHDWLNEQRSYYKSETGAVIRPDATLLLHIQQAARVTGFFLEFERSRQRSEVNVNKLKRYNRYCAEQNYKKHAAIDVEIPRPRILFISNKETEMRKLIEHTGKVDTSSTSGVLYTTLEKLKNDPYGKIFFAKGSTNPNQLYSLLDPVH